MGLASKIALSTVLLVGGFIVGMAVDDDPPTRDEGPAKVVQVPKYIERTNTVEKPYVPESCLKAVKNSQDMSEAVNRYEKQVGDLPRILDDTYLVIINKRLSDINDLKSRQQAAESGSMAALLEIIEKRKAAEESQRRCNKELGR